MKMTGKIYLFLADGFEEIEAIATVDILRRAALEVQTVSIMSSATVVGAHGIQVVADCTFKNAVFEDILMLVMPGGMPGAANLKAHTGLQKLILQCVAAQIPLSAICAAPLVYGKLGLLEGKKATCYPGFEENLKGAILQKGPVVKDGLFTTANGPGATFDFAYSIVAHFCGEAKVAELKAGMMVQN